MNGGMTGTCPRGGVVVVGESHSRMYTHTPTKTTTTMQRKSQRSSHRVCAAAQEPQKKKNVWALDFDGVVCDSCGESAQSAYKVCWWY